MFIFIGVVILLLYALLVFYIGWSSWKWMKPLVSARFKWFYIVALLFMSSSFIWSRFVSTPFFSAVGWFWLAFFSISLLIVPVVHLALWLIRLTSLPYHRIQKWTGAVALIAIVTLIFYGSFNAYSPIVRKYEVNIDKPAGNLKELNIVMASDMHFGLLSGRKHAERMVEIINELKPDLVLYPGDIIDDDLDAYLNKGIDRIISNVKSTYGVYASLGNHDKYQGNMEQLIAALERSNMDVLYDESVVVNDELIIVGRKDKTEQDRASLAELMTGISTDLPIILLDHQPYEFDKAVQSGVDLMLSGHTHRGQIAPAHLITQAMYENDWGLLQKDSFYSIVSSGYGFWGPPIRIGSRSEIVQISVLFTGAPHSELPL
ncbi:putative metallophosphoesterase [compost metagenome]